MSAKLTLKLLAGAVALALAGTAAANTTTSATGASGDIFLNVVDTSKSISFFFDTGLAAPTFNTTADYSSLTSITSDANYATFLSAAGSDSLQFSVIAADVPTTTSRQVYFTSQNAPAAKLGSAIGSVQTTIAQFLQAVDGVTSTTSNSVFIDGTVNNTAYWAAGGTIGDGPTTTKLGITDLNTTGVGGSMEYYSELTNAPSSNSVKGTVADLLGKWQFTNGVLTFTVPTPLPTPLLLLLSGLGLMGVIARRGKSASGDSMINASAA